MRAVKTWLACCVLPLLVLGDTWLAGTRGWSLVEAGAFGGLLVVGCWAWLIAAAIAMVPWRLRRWFERRSAGVGIATAATILVLVVANWGVGRWGVGRWVPAPGFHVQQPGARYELTPESRFVYGVFDRAVAQFDADGLRGAPPSEAGAAEEILCLGGPTTTCWYLDDSETWPAVCQQTLNEQSAGAHVLTAAIDEAGAGHHELFMDESPLVDRFDTVVVMPGAGDLLRAAWQRPTGYLAAGPVWYRSALFRVLRKAWNEALGMGLIVDRTGQGYVAGVRRRNVPAPAREPEWEEREIKVFRNTLNSLAASARERGVRLVLVTQPVLWDEFLSPLAEKRLGLARLAPYPQPWETLRPGRLRELIDQYNQATRDVAREHGLTLVDAAAALSSIEGLYYDDMQLNEEGCRRLGRMLAEQLAAPASAPAETSGAS